MLGPAKPRRLDEPIAVSREDLVPQDTFYRHLEAKLDLAFVRDWARELYAERGRPSIDPVIFFKFQLIMFFEGIRSERQLIYLLLTPVPASFVDPAQPLPAPAHRMRYVPFDIGARGEGWVPGWIGTLDARPTLYATLGTVNNRTPGLASAILAALRNEPINLILTVGPGVDPAEFGEQPPHVHIKRYVPQSRLLPWCDLVVCHGGFGTVLTALDAGLPLLIILIAADQPDNAHRCAELGVAEVISAGMRTPETIRDAVRTVLGEPGY